MGLADPAQLLAFAQVIGHWIHCASPDDAEDDAGKAVAARAVRYGLAALDNEEEYGA